jgi:hypothetical protein
MIIREKITDSISSINETDEVYAWYLSIDAECKTQVSEKKECISKEIMTIFTN